MPLRSISVRETPAKYLSLQHSWVRTRIFLGWIVECNRHGSLAAVNVRRQDGVFLSSSFTLAMTSKASAT